MKLKILVTAVSLLAASAALAVPQYGMPPAGYGPGMYGRPALQRPARDTGPAQQLKAGMDKLMAFMNQEPRPPMAATAEFLNTQIAPFFDFEYMAETAAGRMYEGLDAAGRQAVIGEIKQMFLSALAERLSGYEKQQVRFMRPRPGRDGRTATISVAILNPGQYPARMDFRFYKGDQGWKVYDVAANGQSAVVHMRRHLLQEMTPQPPRTPYPYRGNPHMVR